MLVFLYSVSICLGIGTEIRIEKIQQYLLYLKPELRKLNIWVMNSQKINLHHFS